MLSTAMRLAVNTIDYNHKSYHMKPALFLFGQYQFCLNWIE